MRWKAGRRSDKVIDVRGRGGGGGLRMGGGGLSVGAVVMVVAFSLLTGQNPLTMLGMVTGPGGPTPEQGGTPPEGDEGANFVRSILGETEDVWGALFAKAGGGYQAPSLVLFSGGVQSGCGGASAATGPFYCPLDQRVYLDTSFFDEMAARLGGGGDFAAAYVIAHEVGHHVQHLTGAAERGRGAGATGGSVRLELQADCYAGVWAFHAQQRHQWLESGDLEEALNTASAIGDDRLQKQSKGRVVPDAFTHGSSAQRVRWFRRGFEGGDPNGCDTFSAAQL